MDDLYDHIPEEVLFAIKLIEEKPHAIYIRYLLTKQMLPGKILKELGRLGLSKTTEQHLIDYYNAMIDPMVNKYQLAKYYREYRNKLLKTKNKYDGALSYTISFGKDDTSRIMFCKLIRELDVEEMWSNEITRHYGSIQDVPQDECGERIIKINVTHKADKVLTNPKRYIIDSLMLEEIPLTRIVRFLADKYDIEISSTELSAYKKYFFNFKRKAMEERIEQLSAERTSLESDLKLIDDDIRLSAGDKVAIKRQYTDRINTLYKMVKDLSAMYTDLTFKQAQLEDQDLSSMFKDIINRGYKRFVRMDNYNDRDVVEPLVKIAKMMGYAAEKVADLEKIGKPLAKGSTTGATVVTPVGDKDKHAQETLFELYKRRYDEIVTEGIDMSAGAVEEDIGGLNEI